VGDGACGRDLQADSVLVADLLGAVEAEARGTTPAVTTVSRAVATER
jgi:HD-like signal output (HDOD) protein